MSTDPMPLPRAPHRRTAARPTRHAVLVAAVTVAAVMLAACGSAPRPAGPERSAPPATPAPRPEARASAPAPAPRTSPLAAEQRWLTQLFEGTPVRIRGEPDGGALQLLVPLDFSFEAESPQPKPALQAVLDKLGQSLKRQPASRLRIGAPGPAARALAARRHLLARGVAAHRVEAAASSSGPDVLLRLSLGPAEPLRPPTATR